MSNKFIILEYHINFSCDGEIYSQPDRKEYIAINVLIYRKAVWTEHDPKFNVSC